MMSQYTTLKGHTDAILCVAFDPKGEFLASSSADGTVKLWDITDEATVVKTVRVTPSVTPGSAQRLRIAWHPSGSVQTEHRGSGFRQLGRGQNRRTAMACWGSPAP